MKPERNAPCSCGSGKKYKHCCLGKTELQPSQPSLPECNQLNLLSNAGQHAELEYRARSLIERYPSSGIAWRMLGESLYMQGKDALRALQTAARLLPDDASVHNNLGNALQDCRQFENALTSYRRALQLKSDFAVARSNLGNALKTLGQLDGAVTSYRRALKIEPNFTDAHYNLGTVLQDLGQLNEAAVCYRRALKLKPDFAEAHNNLGNVLHDLGQLNDAMNSFCQALTIDPGYAMAHNNLGLILKDFGQLDAAAASYRRALEIKPDYTNARSNQLFLYGYHALIDPEDYLAQARNWEQACVPARDRQLARHRVFQRPPLVGRRLRVGYVSGDFNRHAVSYFIEQLFASHDKTRVELYAYYTQSKHDAVTERLQALAEHWVQSAGMPDATIRERIEASGIDVLVDHSGHTSHNRMGVFARRAAPIQVHYLGYFASTGLTEMDYWIGDEILTPLGTDSHFSEQVWRLPRVWVSYKPSVDAPEPDWHPASDGSVWVGSFNNLGKLTPATLTLWARVLHALPEGRLLLKTKELADASNRRRILDAMSGHGISPDRIDLQDGSATPDWSVHMAYYDRLDIALDPVGGHGGGTTTCDALWMGAPVITFEGDRMGSRMTASMLNAIGRPEWVARSEAEYIDKVVALARDVEGRKSLRPAQRALMAASPLCDAHGLARSLENAYLGMFERWFEEKNKQHLHNCVK